MPTIAIDADALTFYVRDEGVIETHPVGSVEEGDRRFGPIFDGPVRVLAIAAEPTKGGVSVAGHGVNTLTLKVTSKRSSADLLRHLRDADPDLLVVARRSEDDEDALHLIVEALEGLGITLELGVDGSAPRALWSEQKSTKTPSRWEIVGRQILVLRTPMDSIERSARHAHDDALSSLPVLAELAAAMSPATLSEIGHAPSVAIDRFLARQHLSQGLDVSTERVAKDHTIEGPSPWFRDRAIYHDAWEFDFAAFYPSIIAAEELAPRGDQVGAYQALAAQLQRLRATHRGRPGEGYVKRMAAAMAGFTNAGVSPYGDPDVLREIYAIGEAILNWLLDHLESKGGQLLWHQTDGALAKGVEDPNSVHSALREQFATAFEARIEGPLDVMILGVHDRILRAQDGSIRWKGKLPKRLQELGYEQLIRAIFDRNWQTASRLRDDLNSVLGDDDVALRFDMHLANCLGETDAATVLGHSQLEALRQRASEIDPSARAARTRSENQRAKRRLSVVAGSPVAPCVTSILKRLKRSPGSVDYRAMRKLVAEMRLSGASDKAVALELAKSEVAYDRARDLRFVMGTVDGPRLRPKRWARYPDDQPNPKCAAPEMRPYCDPSACYRSVSPGTFSSGVSPDKYVEKVRSESARLVKLPSTLDPITVVEVPCRGGKSWQIARRALAFIENSSKTLRKRGVAIVVPDHRAGDAVMQELKAARGDFSIDELTVVHRHGRARGGKTDRKLCVHPTRTCSSCDKSAFKSTRGRRKGVFTYDNLQSKAERSGTCGRTLSQAVATHADVVVVTLTSFITGQLDRGFEAIFVDEMDRLAPALAEQFTHRVSLGMFRTRTDTYFGMNAQCTQRCSGCHLQLPHRVNNEGWSFQTELTTASDGSNVGVWIKRLTDGVEELVIAPEATLLPSAEIKAIFAFLSGLESLLRVLHDGVDPRHSIEDLRNGPPDGWTWSETAAALVWELPRFKGLDDFLTRPRVEVGSSLEETTELAWVLLSFLRDVANSSGRLLVEAQPKLGPTVTFMPACSLNLAYFDTVGHAKVMGQFSDARTLMVSGTVGDASLLRSSLLLKASELAVRRANVIMHDDVIGLVHPQIFGRKGHASSILDAVGIAKVLSALAKAQSGRRVLIFASKKDAADDLFKALQSERSTVIDVRRLYPGVALGDRHQKRRKGTPVIKVDIDHLRSGESRAVSSDYDLVVVWGSGRPNYASFGPWVDAIAATSGDLVRRDEIAESLRVNEVVQASLRHAGEDGTRAILLVGDHWIDSLPSYLRGRFLTASQAVGVPNLPQLVVDLAAAIRTA